MRMEREESTTGDERERQALSTPNTVPAPVDRHDQPSSIFEGTATDNDDIESGGSQQGSSQ
jgi:hypothetical protein